MSAQLHIIRGGRAFAGACLALVVASAVEREAQIVTLDASASAQLTAASSGITGLKDRSPATAVEPGNTPYLAKVNRTLPQIDEDALEPSDAQKKVLAHARYQPIKTIIYEAGKRQIHYTLHPFDMIRLAKDASLWAKSSIGAKVPAAKIAAVAITESSGVSRVGWSANGKTPSLGLAQLEPATAKAIGITDPEDPVESMRAIAILMSQGQKFARQYPDISSDIAHSLFYNTGTRLRHELAQRGKDLTIDDLPLATQAHVRNMARNTATFTMIENAYIQHAKQAYTTSSKPASMENPMTVQAMPSQAIVFPNIAALDALRRANNQKGGTGAAISMTSSGKSQLGQRLAALVGTGKPELAAKDRLASALTPYAAKIEIPHDSDTPTQADMAAAVQIHAGRALVEAAGVANDMRAAMAQRQGDAPKA